LIDEVSAGRMVIEFRLEKADASVVRRSWMLIHSLLTPWTRPFPTRPFRQGLLANSLTVSWEKAQQQAGLTTQIAKTKAKQR
jgi:hypothetical protein